jgi:NAD+ synthase (glutamine-hydrolysing)
MKITIAQINPCIGDFKSNHEKMISAIKTAAASQADLICFSEMVITGYPPRDLLERSDFIRASGRALQRLAVHSRQVPGLPIVCGTVIPHDKGGNGLWNAAVVIQNGRIELIQPKTLLPTYDVFDEARYFDAAETASLFECKGTRIGLTVCEDAWTDPDVYFHNRYRIDPIDRLVRAGADLILNLSASPFQIGKQQLRFKLIQNHVKKHKIPVVLVNQIGGQDELIFDGRSFALNRDGNLLHILPGFQEDIRTIHLEQIQPVPYPVTDEIETIYHALILGLRDYLNKCGFCRVVIGLSGGIDSAVTACIAAESLGPDQVLCISMPSRFSSRASRDDAMLLAEHLGVHYLTIPIEPIYSAYLSTLAGPFQGLEADETEENIQARIRGNLLMAFSNKQDSLTLATGNKSELSVGYCTMYGDMSGALSVIGDLPKTMVYALARWINRDQEIIPDSILVKPPSAELKPDQTDQDSLPPYDLLDRIIELYVDQALCFDDILKQGIDEKTARWVIQAIARNEYKRRQAAPTLKVTTKAYGIGRRMPIAARYDCWITDGQDDSSGSGTDSS